MSIHQKRYVMEVLKRFNMLNSNLKVTLSKIGLVVEK